MDKLDRLDWKDNPLYNIINSNNYINNNNKKLDWTDKLDRSDMSDDESDKSDWMDNPLYNIINNNFYYDHQICYLPTIRLYCVCLWIESCEWEEKNVFKVQFIKI